MTHTSRQSVTFIIMRRSSRHLAFIVVGVKAVFMALVVTDECARPVIIAAGLPLVSNLRVTQISKTTIVLHRKRA